MRSHHRGIAATQPRCPPSRRRLRRHRSCDRTIAASLPRGLAACDPRADYDNIAHAIAPSRHRCHAASLPAIPTTTSLMRSHHHGIAATQPRCPPSRPQHRSCDRTTTASLPRSLAARHAGADNDDVDHAIEIPRRRCSQLRRKL